MTIRLKRQFIKLLAGDKEFRYTVAGYLGLGEVLKRLDRIEENIQKIMGGRRCGRGRYAYTENTHGL